MLVHASPILALTYPVVTIFHGAFGLVLLQSVLTAATIVPVYALAKRRLPKPAAFGVALACALYPPLSGEGVGDFHELAFAPVLAASMTYAIDCERWRWAIACAALLALVKEDLLVGLAFIGSVVALTANGRPERRRCGAAIASIGAAGLIVYFFVVRPLIDPHLAYWSFHYYQWWTFPPTPDGFVSALSPERLVYLVDALAPLAFLPLFSRYALFAIPGLVEVLASHEGITFHIGSHYSAAWSGYLLCAFADGAGTLWRHSKRTSGFAIVGALVIALRYDRYDSPIEPGYFLYRSATAADAVLDRRLHAIPRTAPAFVSDAFFAHLGLHPNASIYFHCQQFALVDTSAHDDATPSVARLLAGGAYERIARDGALSVLRRTSARCP